MPIPSSQSSGTDRSESREHIYMGKYSPAQLIKEIQLKAVIKYFYSFSNNQQEKVIIFCADKRVVKLAISDATSGSTLLKTSWQYRPRAVKNVYFSRFSGSTSGTLF